MNFSKTFLKAYLFISIINTYFKINNTSENRLCNEILEPQLFLLLHNQTRYMVYI